MTVDTRLERLYGQIELIRAKGDPAHGQLCIMSFVAFLAGEGHTDHPDTASPAIRKFAIIVNDEMPAHWRQKLKPFAPRILGTNDGLDRHRIEILQGAVRNELLPKIAKDFEQARTWRAAGARKLAALLRNGDPDARLMQFVERLEAIPPGCTAEIPDRVASLISLCAASAADADWYWSKAIELLDRLCDVGRDRVRPEATPDRLAWLEGLMARRERRRQRKAAVLGIFNFVREKFPPF